ncbi:hypothetical protein D3C86_2162760 [compost metagenome]
MPNRTGVPRASAKASKKLTQSVSFNWAFAISEYLVKMAVDIQLPPSLKLIQHNGYTYQKQRKQHIKASVQYEGG